VDHLPKRSLALHQRIAPPILAIRVEKIEREKARLASAIKEVIEPWMTFPIKAHYFSIKHGVGGQ